MKTYKQYRKARSKADLKPNDPLRSWKPEKKLVVLAKEGDDEKVIHFGDANMEDFTQHKDEKRRENYLKRAGGIRNSAGQLTKDDKFSANYWAMRYLWDYKGDRYADGGQILLAPNGKPSNLTSEQYRLVRTKAFKDWFGDWENDPANASKVVDENGEPLVVYHGTTKKFNIFNKADKYREDWGVRDYGMYFSNSYNTAKWYSLDYEKKLREYEEYEEKLADAEKNNDWQKWKEIRESFKKYDFDFTKKFQSINILSCFLSIKNPLIIDANGKEWFKVLKGAVNAALSFNKDGMIVRDVIEIGKDIQTTFVTFEPEQIKLADGSNTTFDGNNPDIRYAGGGQVNPWAVCTSSVGREDKNKYESCVKQVKEKTGYKKANGGSIDSFWLWYTSWVKGFNGKAMNVFISKPTELHGLPIKEDNAVVLDLFEKVDQSIDAKPYLREITTKADEYGVTIYLEPTPRYKYFITDKAKREKISKEYLIGYYEKFGFISHDNGKYMKREPKESAQFAEGGKVETSQSGTFTYLWGNLFT